jgi:hypothetical protein
VERGDKIMRHTDYLERDRRTNEGVRPAEPLSTLAPKSARSPEVAIRQDTIAVLYYS